MKRLILFLLVLCPLAAFAQGGSEALPFIRTDLGPVLTGTAGAAVASKDAGPWSAFRSAAALTLSEDLSSAGLDFRVMGSFPGGGAAFSFKPAEKLGVAVGAMYQSGDKIGDYRTADVLLSAGAGFAVTEGLSVGANVRYAKQNLTADVAYSGLSVDFSILGKFGEWGNAIAGVSSVGGKVTSASGTQYSQPANAYAGAEFGTDVADGTLTADAMAEYYFSGSFAAAAGVTFKYSDLTARLGYRYASQWCIMPTRLAAGLGYSFDNISVNVSFAHMSTQNIVALGVVYKIQ